MAPSSQLYGLPQDSLGVCQSSIGGSNMRTYVGDEMGKYIKFGLAVDVTQRVSSRNHLIRRTRDRSLAEYPA